MFVENPLYSNAEYDIKVEDYRQTPQLTVNEQMPTEAKSKLHKKPWKVTTSNSSSRYEDERAIWGRYHMYLKEKYRLQSMIPVKNGLKM